jgi:voltage-gated potassium channel Kch
MRPVRGSAKMVGPGCLEFATMGREMPFSSKIRYRFDNIMARGTPAMIGLLAAFATVLIMFGGLLMVVCAPTGAFGLSGVRSAAWASFMHLLNPGDVESDKGSAAFITMTIVITIGGILIMSALVGVICAGIDSKLDQVRKGRSVVVEHGHTVVLGWSEQIFTIISELTEANRSERRGCIAILAPRDKVEMEDAVRERLGRTGNTRIVVRSGSPVDPADLALVQPRDAKSVIVLPPCEDDADAQVIKVLLALTHQLRGAKARHHGSGPTVVAPIADRHNLAAARLAGGGNACLIDTGDFISRIMVQTCLQSGLSVVYSELMDFAGDEIYIKEQPELVGRTYGEALPAYRTSAVMGLLTAARQVLLNPPADRLIERGDQVIVITEDDQTVVLDSGPPHVDESTISLARRRPTTAKSLLMLGWNTRATPMVEQLDQYVPPGSRLKVVSDHPAASFDIALLKDRVGRLELDLKDADPTRRDTLEAIDLTGYDHIIVMCPGDLDPQHADSRILVTLLHVRDISARDSHAFTLVTELSDDRNRVLVQVMHPDDFIISEKLSTLRMTQVSENRHLEGVYNDLFDPEGSEIYLKSADEYVLPGVPVDFYTVVEAARRRGETAIGYRLLVDARTPPMHGITLNPDKTRPVTFTSGDSVIVLAEN